MKTVLTALAMTSLCPKWDLPVRSGELNSKIVSESSGLAISRQFEAMYHMNDSGTGPEFHVSKKDGSDLRTVRISDFKPVDPEDLAMGPCPEKTAATCLAIADIGDNRAVRKSVSFHFIEEVETFGKSVKPLNTITMKYPDGAHNAESAALLSNGDLIVITKEMSVLGVAQPAFVFRSKRADYLKSREKEPAVFEKIGEIDFPLLTLQKGFGGLATGMTAIPDGSRFTVLTYTHAIEFSLDLKAPKLATLDKSNFRHVPLVQLPQQESIAYDKNERDLVYSTEIPQRFVGFGTPAPLYKVRCSP